MRNNDIRRTLLLELLKEKKVCKKELMRCLINDHFLIKQDTISRYLSGAKELDEPFLEAVIKALQKNRLILDKNINTTPLDVRSKLNEAIKKHGVTNEQLVKKLANYGFKLSSDSLSKCRRGERRLEAQLFLTILSVLGENTLADVSNAKVIPIAISSKVDCGQGSVDAEENDYTYVRDSEYKLSLKAFRANGLAMAPEIEEDDGIVIDELKKPSHGDLVVYELNSKLACKIYIQNVKEGFIELRPLMPSAKFPVTTIHFNDDEMESVKMYKVVRIIRRELLCAKKRLERLGLN